METRAAIAKKIRELCYERGYTINKLCERSHMPQSTLKSILSGSSKNPGIITLKKLCDALDVSLGEFFSEPEFDERK